MQLQNPRDEADCNDVLSRVERDIKDGDAEIYCGDVSVLYGGCHPIRGKISGGSVQYSLTAVA